MGQFSFSYSLRIILSVGVFVCMCAMYHVHLVPTEVTKLCQFPGTRGPVSTVPAQSSQAQNPIAANPRAMPNSLSIFIQRKLNMESVG